MIYVGSGDIENAIRKLKVFLIKEGVSRALERTKFHRSNSELRRWKDQKAKERKTKVEKKRRAKRGRLHRERFRDGMDHRVAGDKRLLRAEPQNTEKIS